jgi:proteic killer suppression protein
MTVRFEDRGLEEADADPSKLAGVSKAIDKKFRDRMRTIRDAPDERDFYALKSLHFEKLKDNEGQERSMKLNDQWRLIVRLEGEAPHKTVVIVAIKDYH